MHGSVEEMRGEERRGERVPFSLSVMVKPFLPSSLFLSYAG